MIRLCLAPLKYVIKGLAHKKCLWHLSTTKHSGWTWTVEEEPFRDWGCASARQLGVRKCTSVGGAQVHVSWGCASARQLGVRKCTSKKLWNFFFN